MGKLQFALADELEVTDTAEFLTSDTYVEAAGEDNPDHVYDFDDPSGGIVGTKVSVMFPGTEVEPQLLDVRLEADLYVDTHAHVEDEIMYVIEGEMTFGSRRCGPGDAVLIPGMTLYSIKVGPEGARFLNFRPKIDFSRLPKETFLAQRDELRAAADADGGS